MDVMIGPKRDTGDMFASPIDFMASRLGELELPT